MSTERRTEEQIRREIAQEQEELAEAVATLRGDLEARRGPARRILVALAATAALVILVRILRRRR